MRIVRQPLFVLYDIGRFRYLVQPPAALFLYRQKEGKKRLKGRLPLKKPRCCGTVDVGASYLECLRYAKLQSLNFH